MMPVIGLRTTRVSSKTWRRNSRSCQSSAMRGSVPAAWSRARARLRSFPVPPPRRPLRLSGSTTASAAASGWKNGSARSSATTAGGRGIAATRDSIPARLDRRDRLDFDQPVRVRERLHRDERRGGQLLAEDLLADRHQIGAVPDVRQVRVDLDDALDRSARRLHVSQERPEHFARLPLEVAGMEDAARLVVRHLTGKEEYRLCAGDLDDLAVRRRIVDRLRAELLDLRHGISFGRGGLRPPRDCPAYARARASGPLHTDGASYNPAPVATASERSWAVFPAGSPGEYNLPRELTIVLARGEGATVWDTDGRAFTDFTMGWGSVLLGHAHPAIVEAVRRRAALGSNFAYLTDVALELAEELSRAVPCAERLRFCASGTEATGYAVRLARAHTGRSRVLKFEGAYHGANAVGTVSLFPRRLLAFPRGEPTSAGVTADAVSDVLVAPYNDLAATVAILAAHRDQVAAGIVEPLHRRPPPPPGFLAGLRELTSELGMLLIFDETVTGFRLAYGGAQEYYGVRPDLATLIKPLGGGYPRGVVAYRTAFASDRERARAFLLGLFRRGIFLNPMSTKLYLSLAHTEEDVGRFLDTARVTLREDCLGR